MKAKKDYEKAEIKFTCFETEDILSGSGIELPDHEWSIKKIQASETEQIDTNNATNIT